MPPKSYLPDEMNEAMKKLQHAASIAGVSMQEAVAALSNLYKTMQGNIECFNMVSKIEEPVVKMAQALKEEKEQEKQISQSDEPRLYEDFEIPHYDIEIADISTSIDF